MLFLGIWESTILKKFENICTYFVFLRKIRLSCFWTFRVSFFIKKCEDGHRKSWISPMNFISIKKKELGFLWLLYFQVRESQPWGFFWLLIRCECLKKSFVYTHYQLWFVATCCNKVWVDTLIDVVVGVEIWIHIPAEWVVKCDFQ